MSTDYIVHAIIVLTTYTFLSIAFPGFKKMDFSAINDQLGWSGR